MGVKLRRSNGVFVEAQSRFQFRSRLAGLAVLQIENEKNSDDGRVDSGVFASPGLFKMRL